VTLIQAEIAALQLQLKASQSGALDLAAVADEEAAVRESSFTLSCAPMTVFC
jgi:hypothetical protein